MQDVPHWIQMMHLQVNDFLTTQAAVQHQVKDTIVPQPLLRAPVKESINLYHIINEQGQFCHSVILRQLHPFQIIRTIIIIIAPPQEGFHRSAVTSNRGIFNFPGPQIEDIVQEDGAALQLIEAVNGHIYMIMTFQEPEEQSQVIRILKYSLRTAVSTPVIHIRITELLDRHEKFPLANSAYSLYHNHKECRHFHPADGSGAFQKIRRLRQVHPH